MKPLIAVITVVLTLAAQQSQSSGKESSMPHRATGTFDVKIAPLPPYNQDDKSLGRFSIDKQFRGDLEASSKGEMLSAGSPSTSGGYVAIEKVTGKDIQKTRIPKGCYRFFTVFARSPERLRN